MALSLGTLAAEILSTKFGEKSSEAKLRAKPKTIVSR
jgi:hypothetical protein